MNPTKAEIKEALGFKFDTELADLLGISKQAVSQQNEDEEVPDAWCWNIFRARPDVFADASKRPKAKAA